MKGRANTSPAYCNCVTVVSGHAGEVFIRCVITASLVKVLEMKTSTVSFPVAFSAANGNPFTSNVLALQWKHWMNI